MIFSDSPYERQQVTKEKDKRTKEIVTRRWDRAELLKVTYMASCPFKSATVADPEIQ